MGFRLYHFCQKHYLPQVIGIVLNNAVNVLVVAVFVCGIFLFKICLWEWLMVDGGYHSNIEKFLLGLGYMLYALSCKLYAEKALFQKKNYSPYACRR